MVDADGGSRMDIVPANDSFKITFESTNPLRTLVDVVSNILTRIELAVVKDELFEGIHLESIDAKRVCLIVAQLACKVEGDGRGKFCVDASTLNTCLKAVSPHYSVDISNEASTSNIIMHAYESLTRSYTTFFKFPTLVSDADPVKLTDLDYDYTIEMDLQTLRSIVRNTMQLRGNDITIRVEEPAHASAPMRQTVLTILTDGNAEQRHRFLSLTDTKDGAACVIRTEQHDELIDADAESASLKMMYEETFLAQYMAYFLKSMERHVITMRLSPAKPLILNYPLGADASYICFVLEPRTKEA